MFKSLKFNVATESFVLPGKLKLLLILSCILSGFTLSYAQQGSLDSSFNPGEGADNAIHTISIQSDEKIIIGGWFTSYNGTARKSIARLNADGSLDTTFNPGIGVTYDVMTTSIQSDGKIIIGGNIWSYNGTDVGYIARLNTDGSLDTTFVSGTAANDQVRTISMQSDGKIIIGGYFTSYNGMPRNRIARLNPDGSLDTTFDPGTGANSIISATSIQNDEKIIIAGYFTSFNGMARNCIARLNSDGSLDTTFVQGTLTIGTFDFFRTISIQSDGKIIIAGTLSPNGGSLRSKIARLNSDGSLDTTFNPGTGPRDPIYAISIQNDGKIIIGGHFSIYNETDINRIARLNTDGSLDTSFETGTGTNNSVLTSAIQSDEKIIIGGHFTSYNETPGNRIARLKNSTSTSIHPFVNNINAVKVFPNPFNNYTTLHSGIEVRNAVLTIYNLEGQTVNQISPVNIGAGNSFQLNRDKLPDGLYFIQLSHDNQVIMSDKILILD